MTALAVLLMAVVLTPSAALAEVVEPPPEHPPGSWEVIDGTAWAPAGDHVEPGPSPEYVPADALEPNAPPVDPGVEVQPVWPVLPDWLTDDNRPDPLAGIPAWGIERMDLLAECESGGNFAANTGNGYGGGHQYLTSTWRGVRTDDDPLYPWQATREQTFRATWRLTGGGAHWGAFPGCARRHGWPR